MGNQSKVSFSDIDIPNKFWFAKDDSPQEKARHKEEWIRTNGNCCLNHWLGLPEKIGREFPIFGFQLRMRERILRNEHSAINKFTGAGNTEFIPRLELDVMLNPAKYPNLYYDQFAVVTGTNMEFAVQILNQRILSILGKKHPELIEYSKKNEVRLINGKYFRAYPTDHIDVLRGQKDLQFVFVDEAAFFHPNQQERIVMAIDRNVGKTQPHIIWNSTPNGPQGAFYDIFTKAIKSENDYDPITLPYDLGVGTILTDEDLRRIEKLKKENPRLFEQEYNNKFISPVGAAMPLIDDSVISDRTALRL